MQIDVYSSILKVENLTEPTVGKLLETQRVLILVLFSNHESVLIQIRIRPNERSKPPIKTLNFRLTQSLLLLRLLTVRQISYDAEIFEPVSFIGQFNSYLLEISVVDAQELRP